MSDLLPNHSTTTSSNFHQSPSVNTRSVSSRSVIASSNEFRGTPTPLRLLGCTSKSRPEQAQDEGQAKVPSTSLNQGHQESRGLCGAVGVIHRRMEARLLGTFVVNPSLDPS
ncbi:hypothetical protein C8J56DRAFT_1169514 [Mycena floridula]|nr:hypothetical protein C8J56DRAFT_1169514 [Mycena floridula]